MLILPKEKKFQPLDLAFVDGALFKYFAKQNKVKIFSILIHGINIKLKALHNKMKLAAASTNNINFQMSKAEKLLINSKIMVPKKYYNFCDIISKKGL